MLNIAEQITAIVTASNFPGWTAPLTFSFLRFEEFVSFVLTVVGTWVASSLLAGNYQVS